MTGILFKKRIILIITAILGSGYAVAQDWQVTGFSIPAQDSSYVTLKADDIVSARTSNVVDAIAGKVAGVQVLHSSSDPGASSFVVIRGYGSASGSNQPLYVVDGVPLHSTITTCGGKSTSVGGISNIPSDDIESMTILKSAAATALYGSRAANGVVVITTKSGKKGQGRNYTIRYSGGMQFPSVKEGARDYFETGIYQNHAVSFSGVSDDGKLTYYLSSTFDDQDGVMPKDHDTYNRKTIAYRGNYQAAEWLKLSSSMNIARSGNDVVSYRDASVCHNDSKQVFGKFQVDINPVRNLFLTYRMGFDYTDFDRKGGEPVGQIQDHYGFSSSIINLKGAAFTDFGRGYETIHDLMAGYSKKFLDNQLDFSVMAGMNVNERASTGLLTESKSLVGIFADVAVGWNDLLFLEMTARNDWLSTLPSNSNSFFYPGVKLDYLFSNMLDLDDILSLGKLRVAYGKTGNDSGLSQTSVSFDPEITSEFEIGASLEFLDGRIGLDATYYNRKTDARFFSFPGSVATDFGIVRNKGFELVLNATPVLTDYFRWDIGLNFSRNYNHVESLPDGLFGGKSVINSFTAANHAVYAYAGQGKPLGQFYTNLPSYTPDGKIIVDDNGLPVLSDDLLDTGKNMQSDWTGGITTSISYKGISLSAVLDIRYGGYMLSKTRFLKEFTGNGMANNYNERKPFIIPNSVVEVSDGVYVPNETPVYQLDGSYHDFFEVYGAGLGGEFYLIDRSFTKLRNVSLSYSFPVRLIRPLYLSALSMTAYCNNPFVWTAKTNRFIDPETTSYSDCGDLASQFGELFYSPACRTFGFNINITF